MIYYNCYQPSVSMYFVKHPKCQYYTPYHIRSVLMNGDCAIFRGWNQGALCGMNIVLIKHHIASFYLYFGSDIT